LLDRWVQQAAERSRANISKSTMPRQTLLIVTPVNEASAAKEKRLVP